MGTLVILLSLVLLGYTSFAINEGEGVKAMNSKSQDQYYVIKIPKKRVDWILRKDSAFRSLFTLTAEIATVLSILITLALFLR